MKTLFVSVALLFVAALTGCCNNPPVGYPFPGQRVVMPVGSVPFVPAPSGPVVYYPYVGYMPYVPYGYGPGVSVNLGFTYYHR